MGICDKPRVDWAVVLRRRPARIVEGRPEGGYTGAFEIICCYCGDYPDLDYRKVSPELQRVRGPYPLVAGVAAYEEHLGLHRSWRTVHESAGRHTGVNAADPDPYPHRNAPICKGPEAGQWFRGTCDRERKRTMSSTARQAAAAGVQTAYDIGMEGYPFPYPIALRDVTRRQMSGVVAAGQVIGCGRADAFVNVPVFPAEFCDAVRLDFGTLYRVARFDLRDEPRIVSAPPADGCLRLVEWR